MDELGRTIAIHLYENQREIWSHIKGFNEIRKPTGYQETPVPVWSNPFSVRRMRPAVLKDEAGRLYNAIAFAQWCYGLVMNAHVTINWGLLGVADHRHAADILSKFNQESAKWLKVDSRGRRRKNTEVRTWGGKSLYCYAYIHENTNERAFHTHQLFHAADGKAKAYSEWASCRLAELAGQKGVVPDAVFFTPGTKRDGFSPHISRFKSNEVERCWVYFRYLVKNLDPNLPKYVEGRSSNQRAIFKAETNYVEPPPVYCQKLFGCSENIAEGQQKAARFVSKFDSGKWDELYNGSELAEFQLYVQQRLQEAELADVLDDLII